MDLTGQTLKNRYRLEAYLGRGSMAEVYRAFDVQRNRQVAIKVLYAELAEDQAFGHRFQQAAEPLTSLSHRNIVRYYGLEWEGRLSFLVMDYVEGITLRALLEQIGGALPLSWVAHILPQLCQALQFAHENGFIHGDLEPGNVILRADGQVLLADLGIALIANAATTTTFVPGNPVYMSPEQCQGNYIDYRSDVYGLGLVLYELASGWPPFTGKLVPQTVTGESWQRVCWEQLNAAPPAPRLFNPDLPAALERIILGALAKSPDRRIPTAAGLLDMFQLDLGQQIRPEAPRLIIEEGAPDAPAMASEAGKPPPPGSRPETPSAASRRKRGPLFPTTLWLLAFAVIFVLGCVGLASASWVLINSQSIAFENSSETANQGPGGASASGGRLAPLDYATVTLTPAEPVALNSAPTAMTSPTAPSFSLPEPTLAPEPTQTATPAVAYVPTSTTTPTPIPTPTATVVSPPTATPVPVQTETPVRPAINHVIIISVDGLRPDAWDAIDTPALDALRAAGAHSPNAKAVVPSDTIPNHSSMFSGVTPEKHGIFWNLLYDEAPRLTVPTMFDVAREAGFSTAMVVGKSKLAYIVLPNSVDNIIDVELMEEDAGSADEQVKNQAVAVIQAGLPTILFIHFPGVDKAGHDTGWMSSGQLEVLTTVDRLIGEIVAVLREGGYLERTLLIITSDHGGSEGTHGSDSPEDTTIPWLAVGPGVPAGLTLTRNIVMYDTAATVLYVLNLPVPEEWDGQPVTEIFN